MRVRKAVPEGYKSGTYSAFSLWDDNRTDVAPTSATHGAGRPLPSTAEQRELLPFCGINKIGGLDTQAFSASEDLDFALPSSGNPLDLLDPDTMEDVPGLTLSQESVESDDSIGSNITGARTRKRFFADDEESETPDRLGVTGWQDIEISPRSLAPVDLGNGRRMAVPRKGGLRSKLGAAVGSGTAGQENLMAVDNDFEEAPFLDRNLEVDMDDF